MENQSQNIPAHIEIFDDGGNEDTQETHKKSDLFDEHMNVKGKRLNSNCKVCFS